jgi:hypothetical protein
MIVTKYSEKLVDSQRIDPLKKRNWANETKSSFREKAYRSILLWSSWWIGSEKQIEIALESRADVNPVTFLYSTALNISFNQQNVSKSQPYIKNKSVRKIMKDFVYVYTANISFQEIIVKFFIFNYTQTK